MKRISGLKLAIVIAVILGFVSNTGLATSIWFAKFGKPIVCKDHIVFTSVNKKRLICIDLSGKKGSRVKVTADGKVVERGYNDTYGWYIKIDHGNDFVTLYAHNSKILARLGTEVKRDEVIALLGNTGRSTGPHLHYEVRYKNRPINPAKFVNINKLVSLNNG